MTKPNPQHPAKYSPEILAMLQSLVDRETVLHQYEREEAGRGATAEASSCLCDLWASREATNEEVLLALLSRRGTTLAAEQGDVGGRATGTQSLATRNGEPAPSSLRHDARMGKGGRAKPVAPAGSGGLGEGQRPAPTRPPGSSQGPGHDERSAGQPGGDDEGRASSRAPSRPQAQASCGAKCGAQGPLAVLDVFAGVGRIHELARPGVVTLGVELEPEWAACHRRTLVGPDACWPFQGARNGDGYGQFTVRGRQYQAQRVAFVAWHGWRIDVLGGDDSVSKENEHAD